MDNELTLEEPRHIKHLEGLGYNIDELSEDVLMGRNAGALMDIRAQVNKWYTQKDFIEVGIPTKWTWIRNQCLAWKFYKTAEAALKIDIAIRRTYGEARTSEWITWFNYYTEHHQYFGHKTTIFEIRKIIFSTPFCVSCSKTRESNISECGMDYCAAHMLDCDICEFGLDHSICSWYNSLFRNFIDIFFKESKGIEG